MRPDESVNPPPEPAYQPLMIVAVAAAAGIVVDRYLSLSWWTWIGLAVGGLALWRPLWRRERLTAAMIALTASVAAVAGAWHHAQWSLLPPDELGMFARPQSEPVCLEAIVAGAPHYMPAPPYDPLASLPVQDRSRVEVDVTAIRDRAAWRPASGHTTLVVAGGRLPVAAGDRLRLFGHLAAVTPPSNPGEFDYAASARDDGRHCRLSSEFPEAVVRTAAGSSWQLARWTDRLRAGGLTLLRRSLAPAQAHLASAMFLGVREDLEPEQSEAFLETGTVHVLVISGLNVGILAVCLIALLGSWGCSSRTTMLAVGAATLLYALVTGGAPPVIRATVAVLLMCGARLIGRQALGFNLLAAAALVVLAINPSELFHAGAQLSFLGMAVLVVLNARPAVVVDPLDRLIARSRPWPVRVARSLAAQAGKLLVISLAVWIVVSPLVMTRFHLLSPAAILLSPLITLPVTLAMAAGFAVLGLGAVVPVLAAPCGWVCDCSLATVALLTEWARHWPASHFWVAGPSDWWLVGWYGGLALLAAGFVRPPRRWCLALLAGWCALGLTAGWAAAAGWGWNTTGRWLPTMGHRRLDCTFVSVGHGSAVVMRLPGGQTLLYDAGCMGSPVFGERAISAVLWSQGIRHLDAVVLSHADADHYNALPGLLKKFSAAVVYVTPLMFDRQTAALTALSQGIAAAGVPLVEIASGDHLHAADDCSIEVLHPPRRGVVGSDNANSIVLAIEFQGRRLLLTGDLESPGLDDVLAEEPYDCDVLMAPHHGSRFSDPPGMARWSSPEWVVISGSRADLQPAVAAAYSSRGGTVLHTAHSGAVQATIVDGRLAVTAWRP
jgi:competence protein ComEC